MDVSEDNASAYIPSTLCHLCATYHEANNFTFPVINAPFADTDRELTPDYLTDEFLGQTSALVAQNAPVSQAILTDLESLTSGNTITPIPITTEQSLAIPKSRKPKESTINAEMWKVAEADIRLLWQKEGRSRAYILRHLEEKHGLKANERQLLSQISKLKIGRNVKKEDQKAILNVVQYRMSSGKNSNCIRVNGNRVEKHLVRWAKELELNLDDVPSHNSARIPLRLSSGITVKTSSTGAQVMDEANPFVLSTTWPSAEAAVSLSNARDYEPVLWAGYQLLSYAHESLEEIKIGETDLPFRNPRFPNSNTHCNSYDSYVLPKDHDELDLQAEEMARDWWEKRRWDTLVDHVETLTTIINQRE